MRKIQLSTVFGILAVLLFFTPQQTHAEGQHDVPRKLFEIELGGIYDMGDFTNNDIGNMPVKKLCSIIKFLGSGYHYYFKPLKEYKQFEYTEENERNATISSFSAYILPVIPEKIHTKEQLKNENIKYEVTAISWTNNKIDDEKSYYWAKDMCQIFKSDIKNVPEIFDDYNHKICTCTFIEQNRKFSVNSVTKNIRLEYIIDIFNKKNIGVENKISEIIAQDIRPYE